MKIVNLRTKNQADKDFSGLDFNNKIFNGFDFHECVFNGSYFSNVKFVNCNLKHTEFTEAKFTDCTFINTNLDHSDFVYTKASNTNFNKCSFAHIEWRESNYETIQFQECSFYNSTISLCSLNNAQFDTNSSSSFCGASKRYNVFSGTNFILLEDKIDFLKNNYGIELDNINANIQLSEKNQKDTFLTLSVLRYTNRINTEKFIDLIVSSAIDLTENNQRSHFQKAKYLSLICRQTVKENYISVFGLQFLINALNNSMNRIIDSFFYMEIVELIMFLKTHQYETIKSIESEIEVFKGDSPQKITCQFRLVNTYKKEEVEKYVEEMSHFLGIPSSTIQITKIESGSTVLDFIMNHEVFSILIFISFSLSRVSKFVEDLAKIKKNVKLLLNPQKKKTRRVNKQKALTIRPFSIMQNEGNVYYTQINNTVNYFGKDAIKIDGQGEVKLIIISNSSTK